MIIEKREQDKRFNLELCGNDPLKYKEIRKLPLHDWLVLVKSVVDSNKK